MKHGGFPMILCFDIGGTTIKSAEAFSAEDIRTGARIPTPGRDFGAFIAALRDAASNASQPPSRISISIAGVADPETEVATVANIPCLNNRRLRRDLEAELGLPVTVANDADCCAMAEAQLGAGRGYGIVFGIILGTGIGGGVVVRGELLNAAGGFAGEWGHGPVARRIAGQPEIELPDIPCGCGQIGCLDAICSARGLERLHRHVTGKEADSIAIVTAWEKGEAEAVRTVEIWMELLAGPLAMIANLLAADVIPAGGGMSGSAALIDALDRSVRTRMLRRLDRPLVVPAQCRIEPGLIGAALLGLAAEEEG